MQTDDAVYPILVQVMIALGQGAGPVLISRDAILALDADYRAAAERDQARWDEIAPTVLGWARALGALAAHHALHDGRAIVSRADYVAAKDQIARHSLEARGRCPWTRGD
jgi:hypothetical protein